MEHIISILTVVISSGTFLAILFYSPRKRKENAEASTAEITSVEKLINQKEEILADYKTQALEAKTERDEARNEAKNEREKAQRERERNDVMQVQMDDVRRENMRLKDEINILTYYKCTMAGCKRRQPPRTTTLEELEKIQDEQNQI